MIPFKGKKSLLNIKSTHVALLGRSITWVLIFTVLVIVWSSFDPPLLNLIRDDSIVLSERAWANSNLDWLWHLLFFSQNRYTSGGDYFLFRPILFIHTWYMDVLFGDDRAIHYWVSVSIGFFTAGTIFWISRKKIPLIFAAVLGILFLIYPSDRIVFQWSHISPYLLALAFYGIGIYLLVRDFVSRTDKLSIGGMCFLFLASLCQELVPVSLFGLLVSASFAKDPDRQFFVKNLCLVLASFLIFYCCVIIFSSPLPGFFSYGEWGNFVKLVMNRNADGANYFEKISQILLLEGKNILKIFIPIIFIAVILRIRLLQSEKWMLLAFIIPLISLVIGLFLSRIVIRGGFSPWYPVMFLFYVLMVGGVLLGALFRMGGCRKLLGYFFGLILLIFTLTLTIRIHQNINVDSKYELNNFSKIKSYLTEHPYECFGGAEGVDNQEILELNIILYNLSCAYKKDLKPTYFLISRDNLIEMKNIKSNAVLKDMDLLAPIKPPQYLDSLLRNFVKQTQSEYWFSRSGYSSDSLKYGCFQSKPLALSSLKLDFTSLDRDPIFYNITIMLSDKDGDGDLILLSGNRAEIWSGTTNGLGEFELKSSIYLHKILNYFNVNLNFDNKIFINTQLIGSINKTSKLSQRVLLICSFDNATPAEIVGNISYAKP